MWSAPSRLLRSCLWADEAEEEPRGRPWSRQAVNKGPGWETAQELQVAPVSCSRLFFPQRLVVGCRAGFLEPETQAQRLWLLGNMELCHVAWRLWASSARMPSAFPGSPKARKGVWGCGLGLASAETSGHEAQGLWVTVVLFMKLEQIHELRRHQLGVMKTGSG